MLEDHSDQYCGVCSLFKQVVEGSMCVFSDALMSRTVHSGDQSGSKWHDHEIGPEVQCRACGHSYSQLSEIMVTNSCFAPEVATQACR